MTWAFRSGRRKKEEGRRKKEEGNPRSGISMTLVFKCITGKTKNSRKIAHEANDDGGLV
ncbi:MAG TPA: hypothetical protein HPP54_10710 [Nitrospinae bacterium]|nr:hypothetical protein [Nitrospinota bacterium]